MSTRPHHRTARLLAALTSLGLAAATLALLGSPASAGGPGGAGGAGGTRSAERLVAVEGGTAEGALRRAQQIVAPGAGVTDREEATTVMRDLFRARPALDADQRALADVILARPTDGAGDPRGNGYTVPSRKRCTPRACVHYVTSTADAPPSQKWVAKSLKTLDQVYRFQTERLGYRRPVTDRKVGGNAKFDVYLKDLGTGLYGYCAPEYYKPGSRRVASGYCVIDNDFSPTQFSGKPTANLRVTLAHEFFHAVQFAYDFTEDSWLMESTAVWMEERFADSVDDNRQYLPAGQVRQPQVPLDTFSTDTLSHYGNWVWWEYLSQRYGNAVVRDVWSRADANKGKPNMYSTQAIKSALKRRGGLTANYTAFAASNLVPAKNYDEGKSWPSAPVRASLTLGKEVRVGRFSPRVDHLASATAAAAPDASMGKKWRLRVKVKGPNRAAAPGAYVIVRFAKGGLKRVPVRLSKKGRGSVVVPFSKQRVKRVYVTVANASVRYRCGQGSTFACRGIAKDDDRRFAVKLTTVRR